MSNGTRTLYKRDDNKWAWRIKADNGDVVATDAGQGYENKSDAKSQLEAVSSGYYSGEIDEEG